MTEREGTLPPDGLTEWWRSVWGTAHFALRARGDWRPGSRELLDEYVMALVDSERAMEQGDDVEWDERARRAMELAEVLGILKGRTFHLGEMAGAAGGPDWSPLRVVRPGPSTSTGPGDPAA